MTIFIGCVYWRLWEEHMCSVHVSRHYMQTTRRPIPSINRRPPCTVQRGPVDGLSGNCTPLPLRIMSFCCESHWEITLSFFFSFLSGRWSRLQLTGERCTTRAPFTARAKAQSKMREKHIHGVLLLITSDVCCCVRYDVIPSHSVKNSCVRSSQPVCTADEGSLLLGHQVPLNEWCEINSFWGATSCSSFIFLFIFSPSVGSTQKHFLTY